MSEGKITQVGVSGSPITPPSGAKVINAEGRYVTPGLYSYLHDPVSLHQCFVAKIFALAHIGLVDMHSHIGVYSYPEDVPMLADGNEMTNPIFPQVIFQEKNFLGLDVVVYSSRCCWIW
jgi:hypothetical protein